MIFTKSATQSDTFLAPYLVSGPAWSSYDTQSGFNYSRSQSSGYLGGGVCWQGGAANADDGDYVGWYIALEAGTYTLMILYNKDYERAIVDVSLGGSVLGTFDGYSGSTVRNVVVSFADVPVPADGVYELRLTANGKNVSSSDYSVVPQWWAAIRTGA